MEHTQFTLTISSNSEMAQNVVLRNITPILLPSNSVPEGVTKTHEPGIADIAICFSYPTPKNPYTLVTQSLCHANKITLTDLIHAMEHTPTHYSIINIEETLGLSSSELPMYVVSTKNNRLGAGGIILAETLRRILHLFHGKDFFILPSSIHETIVIPTGFLHIQESELVDMVQEINKNIVNGPDRLSDHVYKYTATTMSFSTIRN